MNNRLNAWIGFNDGNCDEDTQLLIDDIKELENKLAEAVKHLKIHCGDALVCPEITYYHSMKNIDNAVAFLESLEKKEGE